MEKSKHDVEYGYVLQPAHIMTPSEFLEQFIKIESNLYSLAPNLDKREGLLNLLQYLKDHKVVPDGILRDTVVILKQRNRIVNSIKSTSVDQMAIEKMESVKQFLKV